MALQYYFVKIERNSCKKSSRVSRVYPKFSKSAKVSLANVSPVKVIKNNENVVDQ